MFLNKFLAGMVVVLSASVALATVGATFNVAKGDKEDAYNEMINNKIESIGFILSDPHEHVDHAYKGKYGTENIDGKLNPSYDPDYKTVLDNLGFFSIAHDEKLRTLLIKAPELGAFSPFNLYIYKMANEDKTYVGHINPDTMLDIAGVKDEGVRREFNAMFPALDAMVDKEIGGTREVVEYDKLTAKPMMEFEIEFDRPEDIDDYIDEYQEAFEEAFEGNKYIIAGYKNFKEAYDDMEADFDKYDAYFVYSICQFPFSYSVFNKGRADAGLFAPCSMYMYIEKDSNKLIVGMAKLENWVAVLGIKDAIMLKDIQTIDKEVVEMMKELGAKEL